MHTTKKGKEVWEKGDGIQSEFVNYIKQALQKMMRSKTSNPSSIKAYINVETTNRIRKTEMLTIDNVLSFYSTHQGYGRLPFKVHSHIQQSLLLAGLPSVQRVIDSIRNPIADIDSEIPIGRLDRKDGGNHTLDSFDSLYKVSEGLLQPLDSYAAPHQPLNQQDALYPPAHGGSGTQPTNFQLPPDISDHFPAEYSLQQDTLGTFPPFENGGYDNTQSSISADNYPELDLSGFEF
jgi:hypothetical protein